MNTSEKLCLQWNDFKENINSAFGRLRDDKDFTDVTLACEDGQQGEAHKAVLIASSPFFLNILKRNKHPHPLIYMKGVKSENLVAMVDFFYHGEANVFQENLDSFLVLAEEFQLKGMRGNQTKKETPEEFSPTAKKKAVSKSLSTKAESKQDPQSFENAQIETEILQNIFETPLTTKNTDFESLNPTTQQTPKEESKQYPQSLENAPNETGNLQNTFESAAALTDHATNYTDFEILNQQVKSMLETSDKKILTAGEEQEDAKCVERREVFRL